MMRRLLGLVLMVLTLHLTLVGADLSCAEHVGHGATHPALEGSRASHDLPGHAQHGLTAAHTSHGSHSAPARDGHDGKGCDIPATPACCTALVSCGMTMAAAAGGRANLLDESRAAFSRVADARGLSGRTAPDTPPPRV